MSMSIDGQPNFAIFNHQPVSKLSAFIYHYSFNQCRNEFFGNERSTNKTQPNTYIKSTRFGTVGMSQFDNGCYFIQRQKREKKRNIS